MQVETAGSDRRKGVPRVLVMRHRVPNPCLGSALNEPAVLPLNYCALGGSLGRWRGHGAGDSRKSGRGRYFLKPPLELALPVGIGVHGARQINLKCAPDNVFEPNCHKVARGAREKSM